VNILTRLLCFAEAPKHSIRDVVACASFGHQLSCSVIDYHELSFTLSLFKHFMIVDGTWYFYRLTSHLAMVHEVDDSRWRINCNGQSCAASLRTIYRPSFAWHITVSKVGEFFS